MAGNGSDMKPVSTTTGLTFYNPDQGRMTIVHVCTHWSVTRTDRVVPRRRMCQRLPGVYHGGYISSLTGLVVSSLLYCYRYAAPMGLSLQLALRGASD